METTMKKFNKLYKQYMEEKVIDLLDIKGQIKVIQDFLNNISIGKKFKPIGNNHPFLIYKGTFDKKNINNELKSICDSVTNDRSPNDKMCIYKDIVFVFQYDRYDKNYIQVSYFMDKAEYFKQGYGKK